MAASRYIDLRREINAMLYGDTNTLPQGHWIIYRRYKIGEHSKYWDEDAQEALGGPKWKYTDKPIRATYKIGSSLSGSQTGSLTLVSSGIPGDFESENRVYIFEHCMHPKISDHIFEYHCEYPDNAAGFIEFARTHSPVKYKLKNVEPIRVDNKIVYYLAVAKLDQERE